MGKGRNLQIKLLFAHGETENLTFSPCSCSCSSLSGDSFSPPTVTATKKIFLESYPLTISPIYNTALQEILVQQHFVRYNIKYQYDAVFALGVVTVLNQLLSGYKDEETRKKIFKAYIKSLDEDPAEYEVVL